MDHLDNISIKGFDVIRKDRIGKRGGGVLILVRSNIKYSIINDTPDCQGKIKSCGIDVYTEDGKISIISIYRPPESLRISSNAWCKFFSHFKGQTIIGADFNLPKDSIISLLDGITNLDFVLLNDNSPTFWNGDSDRSSILDLTFVNSALGLKTAWWVHNDS